MRLWSIHPEYLDAKGLVALWREGLLAQNVLAGKTKGYKNHPQLQRFQLSKDPLATLGLYLFHIAEEARRRNYCFDRSKIIELSGRPSAMTVTRAQLQYETAHLLQKLKTRDRKKFGELEEKKQLRAHPIFYAIPGPIESWEKIR